MARAFYNFLLFFFLLVASHGATTAEHTASPRLFKGVIDERYDFWMIANTKGAKTSGIYFFTSRSPYVKKEFQLEAKQNNDGSLAFDELFFDNVAGEEKRKRSNVLQSLLQHHFLVPLPLYVEPGMVPKVISSSL